MISLASAHPPAASWPEQPPSGLLTVADWWRFAVSMLRRHGVAFGQGTEGALDDAAFLVLGALDLPLGDIEPFRNARLTTEECERLHELLRRRIQDRVPVAYLLGFTELHGWRFKVDPRVLIPRSYLAELIQEAMQPWWEPAHEDLRVLDMCCGSACLAIMASAAFPSASITAADLSVEALAVAAENVTDYQLSTRIGLVESDVFSALRQERFDLILCNPPYVTTASMAVLPAEFRHEPALALAAGEDGNDFLRRFLSQVPLHLKPGGAVFVDIGHNRDLVEAAFPTLPFTWIATAGAEAGVFMLKREDF